MVKFTKTTTGQKVLIFKGKYYPIWLVKHVKLEGSNKLCIRISPSKHVYVSVPF